MKLKNMPGFFLFVFVFLCFQRSPPAHIFLSLFKGVVTFFIPKFIHYNVVVSTHTIVIDEESFASRIIFSFFFFSRVLMLQLQPRRWWGTKGLVQHCFFRCIFFLGGGGHVIKREKKKTNKETNKKLNKKCIPSSIPVNLEWAAQM